jgi:regulator of sirC expression with transglutaminase-like and TPR domain
MADRYSKDTAQQRTYRAFEALITGEDAAIDLAQASLLIASTAYPELDSAHYLAQLDELARRVRIALALPGPELSPQLPEATDPLSVIEAINQVLFEEEHFHGNEDDYHNPDNSFLNIVLEQHTGIPISLSIIYMEVGRRVGIQIDGIGLPMHFVIRCQLTEGHIYIDPFHHGRLLTEQDCIALLRRIAGGKIKMNTSWFKPLTHHALLKRVLNNLKRAYIDKEDFERALTICDLLVLLSPHSPVELRDRGILHFELKHYAHALHDLKAYIQLAPQAKDRYEILNHIKTIRQTIAMMN